MTPANTLKEADLPALTASTRQPPQRVRVIIVSVMLLLLLAPFIPLVLASFAEGYFFPQVLPDRWSTRAWRIVFDPSGRTFAALRNTVTIGVSVMILSLVVAIPAGRVLGTRLFAGKRTVELILLAPVLVPAIAVAIGIHVVFVRLGLAGGIPGVVLAHLIPATPYVILLSTGVFANADLALEEQARSLGANWWRTRLHVTLPLIAPGLAVAALFGFLISWGQYVLTLVIGSGRVITLPIPLFATASGGDASVTAATALFHSIPAVLLLIATTWVLGSHSLATLGRTR